MHRYPGRLPFESTDKPVFFGRNREIADLKKYVGSSQLTVLYSKSGLGKTSLINAGLVPELEEEEYFCLKVRFYGHRKEDENWPSLLDKFLGYCHDELAGAEPLRHKLSIPYETKLAWLTIKELQYRIGTEKQLLIILDQAEEMFTYPQKEIDELADAISAIINEQTPEEVQEALSIGKGDKAILEARNFFYSAPPVKFLMGIRSDKLSLLDRVKSNIKGILDNLYELSPLDRGNAKLAIVIPSQMVSMPEEGLAFDSPEFLIPDDLLDNILDFLSNKGSKPMETFLLQLICSHMEDIAERKVEELKDQGKELSQTITIDDKNDLPDLSRIISNYYLNILFDSHGQTEPKPPPKDAVNEIRILKSRYLIETILIDVENNYRISVDENYLESRGISQQLLESLIKARFLRKTPNSVDGWNFELSHDTLIEAIRTSVDPSQLPPLKESIRDYYRKWVENSGQKLIEQKVLDLDKPKFDTVFTDREKQVVQYLIKKEILRLDSNGCVAVYAMFMDVAKERRRRKHLNQVFWYKRGVYMAGVIALCIGALAVSLIYTIRQKNDSINQLELTKTKLTKTNGELMKVKTQLENKNYLIEQRNREIDSTAQRLATSLLNSRRNEFFIDMTSGRKELLEQSIQMEFTGRYESTNGQILDSLINYLIHYDSLNSTFTKKELSSLSMESLNEIDSLLLKIDYSNPTSSIETPLLLRKTIEGIKATDPETLRFNPFNKKEIRTILPLSDQLIVASSDSMLILETDGSVRASVAFPKGLENAGCSLQESKNRIYCFDKNSSSIAAFDIENYQWKRSTKIKRKKSSQRIDRIQAYQDDLYVLWGSSDFERIKLSYWEDEKHDLERQIIGEHGVQGFAINDSELALLYKNTLITHRVSTRQPIDTLEIKGFLQSDEEFKGITKIPGGNYLLLTTYSDVLRVTKGSSPELLKNIGYYFNQGLISDNSGLVSIYGLRGWKVFNKTIDDSPLLSYELEGRKQNIQALAFDTHNAVMYVGTNDGIIIKIPTHTTKAHELLELALNKIQKP